MNKSPHILFPLAFLLLLPFCGVRKSVPMPQTQEDTQMQDATTTQDTLSIANQQLIRYDERYKFTGKERDTETGYDYFGARYFWSSFGHWLSVDPLADKYPNISPYAYCNWNPIKYVDPDGLEILNKMSPNSEELNQQTLYEAGNRLPDKNNHLFFIAHGSPTAMYPHGEEPLSAEDFVAYITENSDLWNSTEDKSSLVIVLISCNTGKGDNPIAQQISSLLPEVTIIAPMEEVKAGNNGVAPQIIGVAKQDAENAAQCMDPSYSGQWRVFRRGEQIGLSDATNTNEYIRYIYQDNF